MYLQVVAVSFLFTFVFSSNLSVFPLTVTQGAVYPARVYGALVAVNGVLIAFFEITIVAHLKRFRRLRVAALGNLLCAAGFGMLGLVMHWSWFLLAVLVFTAGEILAAPQAMSFVADWAPPGGARPLPEPLPGHVVDRVRREPRGRAPAAQGARREGVLGARPARRAARRPACSCGSTARPTGRNGCAGWCTTRPPPGFPEALPQASGRGTRDRISGMSRPSSPARASDATRSRR